MNAFVLNVMTDMFHESLSNGHRKDFLLEPETAQIASVKNDNAEERKCGICVYFDVVEGEYMNSTFCLMYTVYRNYILLSFLYYFFNLISELVDPELHHALTPVHTQVCIQS